MHSPFVKREWEHALSLRRRNFIRPCYWESPLPACPEKGLPPEELRRLHFQRIPVALRQPKSELVRIEQYEDAAVVHILCAELDEQVIARLKDELDPLQFAVGRRVVLDMGAVQYLSSGAVGVLLRLQKHLHGQGGELRLRGLRPKVSEVLKTCGRSVFAFDEGVRETDDHTTASCASSPEVRKPEGMLGHLKGMARAPHRRYPSAGALASLSALLLAVVVLLAALPSPPRLTPLGPGPDTSRDGSLQRVLGSGRLVIATDPTYPPMEFVKGGELAGFDVDLGRRLAERLSVRPRFVTVDWRWQDLADRLDSHEFDVLLSTVTVNEDRKRGADFVEYLTLYPYFVCRRGVTVRGETDLAGKVVAVQKDTIAERLVATLRRNGVAVGEVQLVPAGGDPFQALRDGKADVTLADEPVARYYARLHPRHLVVAGPVSRVMDPNPVGIALSKKDGQLKDAVAREVEAMQQDGTFERLKKKWFGR
jgi:polar amino acid transport system substrate-binding protein